jgi:uncharacterized membrane protein
MREEQVDWPVKVSSEVRAHSAIRKLARACIALARWQREQEAAESAASDLKPPTTDIKAVEQAEEDQHG